eukprot:403373041
MYIQQHFVPTSTLIPATTSRKTVTTTDVYTDYEPSIVETISPGLVQTISPGFHETYVLPGTGSYTTALIDGLPLEFQGPRVVREVYQTNHYRAGCLDQPTIIEQPTIYFDNRMRTRDSLRNKLHNMGHSSCNTTYITPGHTSYTFI